MVRRHTYIHDKSDGYASDARPDLSQHSTDDRMRSATRAALDHFTIFVHPEIYICDDAAAEGVPFIKEFKAKASKEWKALIELPQDAPQRLMWMTRLDTGSLRCKVARKPWQS